MWSDHDIKEPGKGCQAKSYIASVAGTRPENIFPPAGGGLERLQMARQRPFRFCQSIENATGKTISFARHP